MYMENVKKYHKLFSFWSVNVLAVHKIKADWSVRDRNIVQLIASISKSCSMLAEVSHNCTFFLQLQTSSIENSFQPINIDRNGRKVVMHNEHKICSDYNSLKNLEETTALSSTSVIYAKTKITCYRLDTWNPNQNMLPRWLPSIGYYLSGRHCDPL